MKKLMFGLAAAMVSTASLAQYPDRPITIVVPFTAGGPTDKVARDFAEGLRKQLGKTVVIDNVGGVGGTTGAVRVFNAKPDGYTLLLTHIGMATAPALYRNLQYKPLDDFEYLGLINEVPMTLVSSSKVAAQNYAELEKWVLATKSGVNLAHAGIGSASHLCGLLYQSTLKVEMTTVAYKGTANAMSDLLGGQVDLLCDQTTNTVGQLDNNRLRFHAVSTSKRLSSPPGLAKLPTLDEVGVKGFNVTIWHGLYAPKGTPAAITERLNTALKAVLKDPDFIKSEEAMAAVVVSDGRTNPAEHKKFVESEITKWGPVIRANTQYAD